MSQALPWRKTNFIGKHSVEKVKPFFMVQPPLRCGLIELSTLNLALIRSQPKLCEDPLFFFLFIYFLYYISFSSFLFWDPRYVYVCVLLCFDFRFHISRKRRLLVEKSDFKKYLNDIKDELERNEEFEAF